jgi:hypothetical protein
MDAELAQMQFYDKNVQAMIYRNIESVESQEFRIISSTLSEILIYIVTFGIALYVLLNTVKKRTFI